MSQTSVYEASHMPTRSMPSSQPNTVSSSTQNHRPAPAPRELGRRLAAGEGVVRLRLHGARTSVVRAEGANPLKLMVPRRRVKVPHIYTSSYGGGLLAGDETSLSIHAEAGAHGVLTTQASTKIYKNPKRLPCGQTFQGRVEADAVLVVAPESVCCFANSRYDQQQRFSIDEGGNLVVVDWMTSGRYEVGERYQFDSYSARLAIFENGRHVLEDAIRLAQADGPIDAPFRMGRFNCLATMVILGPQFASISAELLQRERQETMRRGQAMIAVVQSLSTGVLIRVLCEVTQDARLYFDDIFEKIDPIIGTSTWAGKL